MSREYDDDTKMSLNDLERMRKRLEEEYTSKRAASQKAREAHAQLTHIFAAETTDGNPFDPISPAAEKLDTVEATATASAEFRPHRPTFFLVELPIPIFVEFLHHLFAIEASRTRASRITTSTRPRSRRLTGFSRLHCSRQKEALAP